MNKLIIRLKTNHGIKTTTIITKQRSNTKLWRRNSYNKPRLLVKKSFQFKINEYASPIFKPLKIKHYPF